MPTKTELIWDGNYDAKGNRVAPVPAALPFQTLINESDMLRQTLMKFIWGKQSLRLDMADRLGTFFGLELRSKKIESQPADG